MGRFYQMGMEYLKNLRLKQKLLLIFFALSIIPLIALAIFAVTKSSAIVEQQMMNSTMQLINQTSSFLTYKLRNMKDNSNLFVMNPDIQEILTRDPQSYSIGQQINDVKKMESFIHNLESNNKDIFRIRLYVRDGLIYSNEQIHFFDLKEIRQSQWYQKILSNNGKISISPAYNFNFIGVGEKKIVSMGRVIRNLNNFSESIGVVSIDILESNLHEVIQKAKVTPKGAVYLINELGEVISSSNDNADNDWLIAAKHYQNIETEDLFQEKVMVRNHQILVTVKTIEDTPWKLVVILPLSEVLSSSTVLRNYILILMIIIGAIAYIAAFCISNYYTQKVDQVIKTMGQVQQGDLNVRILVDSGDEIGELEENFNFMVEKMSSLVQERFKVGQELKNVELKALQAQINPHFLYNTLDLINWMALKHNAPDISFTVNALSKFYKLSLGKGKDVVSIADELRHIKIYVQIQNKRFEDRIALEIMVDEAITNCASLKLILQPLVENSILHGIMEKKCKTGTICIAGKKENDIIIITIADDGIGLSEDKRESILDEGMSNDGHGYGVRNIHNRIKLYYGEEFGLSYPHPPGEGTIVEIRFPAYSMPNSTPR